MNPESEKKKIKLKIDETKEIIKSFENQIINLEDQKRQKQNKDRSEQCIFGPTNCSVLNFQIAYIQTDIKELKEKLQELENQLYNINCDLHVSDHSKKF